GDLFLTASNDERKPQITIAPALAPNKKCAIRLEGLKECRGDSNKCTPVDVVNFGSLEWRYSDTYSGEDSSFVCIEAYSNNTMISKAALAISLPNDQLQATIGISVRDFNWTLPNDDEKAKMVLEITRRGHCEHSYFNTTGLADVYQED